MAVPEILAAASHVDTARYVVELAVKATVVLTAAAGAAWCLRRASAATRHLVWSSALVMVLALPFWSLVLPSWNVPLVRVAAAPDPIVDSGPLEIAGPDVRRPAPHAADRHAVAAMPHAPIDHVQVGERGAAPVTEPASAPAQPANWVAIALGVWLVGSALTVLRLTLGVLGLWLIETRTPVMLSREWLELTSDLSRRLDLRRPVRLLQSRRAAMPLSWGWIRPVVLLPVDADTWSVERRRIVLLHELAHVKRRDCLTQFLAQLVCAAHWFNPLAWFAASRLRAERERACDDLVLSVGTRSADYADHLLDIARAFRTAGFPSWATVAMAKPSQLEGRLLAILDPSRRRRAWPRWACAAAVGAIAAVALPVAAVQPWARIEAAQIQPDFDRSRISPTVAMEAAQPASQTNQSARGSNIAGGLPGGVPGGIVGGITQGVVDGVRGGVSGGVRGGVAGGPAGGVEAMPDEVDGDPQVDVDTDPDDSDQDPRPVPDRRVTDALVTALKDDNTEVRQQAAQTLGRIADVRAIDGLTVALRDVSPEVREQAASSLSRFKSSAAAGALLLALKDSAPAVRRAAVGGLARMRDPKYADAFTMMLQDPDREVRQQAAAGLGSLRVATAIEPLTVALKDVDDDVRQQAAVALAQLRDPRTTPALIAALNDADKDVRHQVVFALGQLRAASAVDPLIVALRDQDADVREQAAFALGQIRDVKAVDALSAALKDAGAGVREQAVFALGQIRAVSATPALIAALSDKTADVREQAAFALGQLRDPRAVDALSAALRDPDADVREQAAFALGQLVGKIKDK